VGLRRLIPITLALVAAVAVAVMLLWSPEPEPLPTPSAESPPVAESPPLEAIEPALAPPRSTAEPIAAQATSEVDRAEMAPREIVTAFPTIESPMEFTGSPLCVIAHVTDEGGNPIAEALVTVGSQALGYGRPLAQGQTDFEGRCEISLPGWPREEGNASTMLVTAETPGWARIVRSRRLEGDESEIEVDLTLVAGGQLAGTIRWESGEPVPHAEIMVFNRSGQEGGALGWGRSESGGRFHLENLMPGRVTLTVSPEGGPYQHGGHCQVGETDAEVTLRPRSGVVRGCVIGAVNRDPFAGVEVWLGDFVSGYDSWQTSSDESGEFLFEGIPLESWRVSTPSVPVASEQVNLYGAFPEQFVEFLIPEPMTLTGRVIRQETQEPLADFPLAVQGARRNGTPLGEEISLRSDDSGRFEVVGLTPEIREMDEQRLLLCVRARCLEEPWIFNEGQSESTFHIERRTGEPDLNLRVTQGRPLEALAVDPVGRPVPGVTLRLYGPRGNSSLFGVTDAAGRCEGVVAQVWESFQMVGIAEEWPLLLSEMVSGEVDQVVVEAAPVTDLTVHVIDGEEQPVAGADVYALLDTNEPRHMIHSIDEWRVPRGETDSQGQLVFHRIPRLPHAIRALVRGDSSPHDYAMVTETIDLASPEAPSEITLQILPQPMITVSGRVLDLQDDPVVGATVHWRVQEAEFTERMGQFSVVAGPEGEFTIRGNEQIARFGLAAEAEGYTPGQWRDRGSQSDAEIRLAPSITLTGRVVHSDGSPALRLPLMLWIPDDDHWFAGWEMDEITSSVDEITDTEGHFLWTLRWVRWERLPAPAWVLALTHEGFLATADLSLDLDGPQRIDLGTMTLQPGLALEGQVLNPEGEPLEGVRVRWEQEDESQDQEFPPVEWQVRSDAEGRFRLWPLPPGHWRIGLERNGFNRQGEEIDLLHDIQRTFIMQPREEQDGS
jgi:Carboxypeptidase regulatory-like domain